jgi:hypothetical protein
MDPDADDGLIHPQNSPITQQSVLPLSSRLIPSQIPATFVRKATPRRNHGEGPSVNQGMDAFQEAKQEMPTNYTESDFVLIRLHELSAGTISILVTNRERVGRSMS